MPDRKPKAEQKQPPTPHIDGYRFMGVLGAGGMGVVFKAEQQMLRRPVAIKALALNRTSNPQDVQRLLHEARTLAAMGRHDNIVQVFDVVTDWEGNYYIVMEFVEGRSLDQVLKEGEPPGTRDAVRIVIKAGRALAHAHERGVIHRDIKPGNIMLTEKNEVRVMDFGLARHQEMVDLTQTGRVVGTPTYMSPEQLSGRRDLDGRTDIYSLACVLYHLICGRPPFTGDNAYAVGMKHIADPPVVPSTYWPALPRELEDIILKGLQKDPDKRFQSATAMSDALQDYIDTTMIAVMTNVPPPVISSAPPSYSATFAGAETKAAPLLPGVAGSAITDISSHPTEKLPTAISADEETRVLAQNKMTEPQRTSAVVQTAKSATKVVVFVMLMIVLVGLSVALGIFFTGKSKPEETSGLSLAPSPTPQPQASPTTTATTADATPELAATPSPTPAPAHRQPVVVTAPSRRFEGPVESIYDVLILPGGRMAASGFDSTIRIWSISNGAVIATSPRLGNAVNGLALLPDGKTLAAAGADQSITLWDVESVSLKGTLRGHRGPVSAMMATPDGARLVSTGFDRLVGVWDVASASNLDLLSGHEKSIRCITITANGLWAVTGDGGGQLRLWDLTARHEAGILGMHGDRVNALAAVPGAAQVLSASADGTVALWDLESRTEVQRFRGHVGPVTALTISPDGRQMLSASQAGQIILWSFPSGEPIATFADRTAEIRAVRFVDEHSFVAGGGIPLSQGGFEPELALWQIPRL